MYKYMNVWATILIYKINELEKPNKETCILRSK